MGLHIPGVSIVARTLLGFPLAAVVAVIGMAVGSAMAVFFGVSALPNILTLLMIGAGVGAGIGAGLTLLRVDSIPSWLVLLAVGLALAALGYVGGWVGFQVGEKISAIEDANCVGVCGYFFKPRTYIALGATLLPNLATILFNIGYEGGLGRWGRNRQRNDDSPLQHGNDTDVRDNGSHAPGRTS